MVKTALPMQGVQVRSLVGGAESHMPAQCGQKVKKIKLLKEGEIWRPDRCQRLKGVGTD